MSHTPTRSALRQVAEALNAKELREMRRMHTALSPDLTFDPDE